MPLDSRARLVALTPEFADLAAEAVTAASELEGIPATGGGEQPASGIPVHDLEAMLAAAVPDDAVCHSTSGFPAFWLYASLLVWVRGLPAGVRGEWLRTGDTSPLMRAHQGNEPGCGLIPDIALSDAARNQPTGRWVFG